MPSITWSSQFETGIGIIDAQHQALFNAVNELADAFKAGRSGEQVKSSLDFLINYTAVHFHTEEGFMWDMDYPGLAAHVAEHAELTRKALDLRARLEEGERVSVEVALFIASWWKHHIKEADMGYVAFMKKDKA
jgi:hemerythrin